MPARIKNNLAEDRRSLDKVMAQLTKKALDHYDELLTNPVYEGMRWSDRSVKAGVSSKLIELAAAEARARREAEGARVLGMVVVQARIEDTGQWEKFAAQGGQPVIEAVATEVEEK